MIMTLVIPGIVSIDATCFSDASALYAMHRDYSGEGVSTFPAGRIDQGGETIARVSYNGRVWGPGDWKEGDVPLFDPSAACACGGCPVCDTRIDRWNDGALDGCRGIAPRLTDADYLAGHADGIENRKVKVVMFPRPEGYYHAPVGTFD